jgi:stearoyl-CoA desaturase (delta-9 desaturase)
VLFAIWYSFAKTQLRKDLMFGRATFFLIVHFLALWGMLRACTHASPVQLWLEVLVMWQVGGFGITCGAHRLWSHRSYDAKLPFKVVLMLLNSFANQATIFHWARDHRAHHKYTDTEADPHDATRGFFFAHIGWLLLPKTAELKKKGETIPCGDLLADPAVAFQKWAEERFMFMELMSFGLPALYGYVVYNDVLLGFLVHGMLRWLITLHATWCVNSVAHYFGEAKYDTDASARESLWTSVLAVGEGWHSYHHKFPWDYATSEFGVNRQWNPSKLFIDVAAALGQVTHKKRADHHARKQRGD